MVCPVLSVIQPYIHTHVHARTHTHTRTSAHTRVRTHARTSAQVHERADEQELAYARRPPLPRVCHCYSYEWAPCSGATRRAVQPIPHLKLLYGVKRCRSRLLARPICVHMKDYWNKLRGHRSSANSFIIICGFTHFRTRWSIIWKQAYAKAYLRTSNKRQFPSASTTEP